MGSLIGGVLYHEVGGKMALMIFCAMSFLCSVMHFVLYQCILKHTMPSAGMVLSGSKQISSHRSLNNRQERKDITTMYSISVLHNSVQNHAIKYIRLFKI
jgi:hypothetical protein